MKAWGFREAVAAVTQGARVQTDLVASCTLCGCQHSGAPSRHVTVFPCT